MTVNGIKNKKNRLNKKNLEIKYVKLKERLLSKEKENRQLLIELDKIESDATVSINKLQVKTSRYKKFSLGMLLIFFCFSVFNFIIYNSFSNSKASENDLLIAELASKINIDNENPIIVEVKNTEKLLSNPVFSNVSIGDTVFIYNDNKIMLVYNSLLKKIISIHNIDFEI